MINIDGQEYGEDYTDYQEPSQSFPSGHTTKTYNRGLGLATLLPELGPELVARAAEGGNNRVVLGVHYPMDVIGGRISASASVTALWSDATFRQNVLLPAHDELENYIAARCKADGNGDTVAACVSKTGANDKNGYKNTFTDAVSTEPVTDRASAIDAYTARMTYGFSQTSAAGQAPVVPQGAENLLLTAFPDLTDAQRRQVLEASEIDSGYPLDASSNGFERINLAKAFSAKVTLSEDGSTITAISFGAKAPTVVKTASSKDTITGLLTDFNKYYVAGKGVTDEGKSVLAHDDQLTEDINNKAYGTDGNTAQDQRALSDAQMNSTNTLYDALGPVLGKYYKDAADAGKLPKTAQFLSDMNKSASTGVAKATYQHPRPYVDRVNFNGTTLNMNGLKQTLNIKKVPGYENFDWGDGEAPDNEYDGLYNSGKKIILAGHSAGGNLVASVLIKNEETKELHPCCALMEYFPTDNTVDPVERLSEELKKDPFWVKRAETEKMYTDFYVGDADPSDPLCSPAFAKDQALAAFPDCLIISAGEDSLRDDTEAFGMRLAKAGVCVTMQRITEAMHGFTTNRTPGWERALDRQYKFFQEHLR